MQELLVQLMAKARQFFRVAFVCEISSYSAVNGSYRTLAFCRHVATAVPTVAQRVLLRLRPHKLFFLIGEFTIFDISIRRIAPHGFVAHFRVRVFIGLVTGVRAFSVVLVLGIAVVSRHLEDPLRIMSVTTLANLA